MKNQTCQNERGPVQKGRGKSSDTHRVFFKWTVQILRERHINLNRENAGNFFTQRLKCGPVPLERGGSSDDENQNFIKIP